MPPGPVQNLYAAAELLRGTDVRERQLSQAQQRALGAATTQNITYFLVLGISAFPAFCLAVAQIMLNIEEDGEDWIQASVLLITPFLVVAGVGLFIFSRLVKRRRQLQDACAAVPPPAPGEPCACHVCGAPLAAGQSAVVRCGHCSADNVVEASVVARATRHRQYVLADYASHLRGEIAAVNREANRATLLSFASALLLPPATVVLLVLIVFPLIMITRPADPSVRYTHEKRARGDCIGKVTMKRAGGAKLYFATSEGDEEEYPAIPSLAGREILHAKDFVGRDVVIGGLPAGEGKTGRVASVSSDVITGNHLDVRLLRGGVLEAKPSEHPSPEGCCFLSPSEARAPSETPSKAKP